MAGLPCSVSPSFSWQGTAEKGFCPSVEASDRGNIVNRTNNTVLLATNGQADPARPAEAIIMEDRVRESAELQPQEFAELQAALITMEKLARLLAISKRGAERLEAGGGLGPRRVMLGRLVRFRRDEVVDWIAAGCPRRADWNWPAPAAKR
jgi:excisionase family DNA binding protein